MELEVRYTVGTPRVIGIDKRKLAVLVAAAGFAAAWLIPLALGIALPASSKLTMGVLTALAFSAGSLMFPTYLLAVRVEGGRVANVFPPCGHGSVNLAKARLSVFPSPVLLRLVDRESGASALLPRPFWADAPDEITRVLAVVRRGDR